MIPRTLVYLGPADDEAARPASPPRWDGEPLAPGTRLPVRRTRSPWWDSRPVERVIIGTHPTRADLRLEAPGIAAEHIRFYFSKASPDINDLRALAAGAVGVNGELVGDEWCALRPGDEVRLAGLRFRFEIGEPEPAPS